MRLIKNIYSNNDAYRSHLQFWDTQIASMEETCVFKTSGQSSQFDEMTYSIPETTELMLRRYAPDQGLGLFVLLSSVVAYLAKVYTGKRTVRIDSPQLSGGRVDSLESASIPLVFDVVETASARDFISSVKQVVSKTYSYQNISLSQFYDLQEKPSNIFLYFEGLHLPVVNFQHDLNIGIVKSNGLQITFHVRKNIARASVVEFANSLIHLTGQLEDLLTPLSSWSILNEDQRRRIAGFGTGVQSTPQPFIAQFQRIASTYPQHLAVAKEETFLTFGALNESSNRLANFLKNRYNVKKGSRIGMLFEKSQETVVALVAVLKLGAVYVPINPANPRERIEYMINDAGISLLLIHSIHLRLLSSFYSLPMIALDVQLKNLKTPGDAPGEPVDVRDPAYIIYTSGTTGLPKGIVCNTEGILLAANHYSAVFGLTPHDRYLQFLSLAFDGAMLDLLVCLTTGSPVVFPGSSALENANNFAEEIRLHDVSVAVLTPSFARNVKTEVPHYYATLKHLVFAGESLQSRDLAEMQGHTKIYNAYGPTEGSVVAAMHAISGRGTNLTKEIPIGKPVPGRTLYILDEAFRPCPPEVQGQICIAGSAVALGYLNSAELSNTYFVPSPMDGGKSILYLTGDLGSWSHDGTLHFLGRKDSQIKLNGFRISLIEIDAALSDIEGVQHAVSIFDKENQVIHAYIVSQGEFDEAGFKAKVEQKVPSYMVPGKYFFLDKLPLDANGKMDTGEMKRMMNADDRLHHIEPENDTEWSVLEIWKDVLGLSTLSVVENFFKSGGNSLKAIQILTRIQKTFGHRIGINVLFANPTIRSLAGMIDSAKALTTVETIQPIEQQDYYSVSSHQKQLWLLNQMTENKAAYNVASAYRITGDLDRDALQKAIEKLVARHENLRSVFLFKNYVLVQKVLPGYSDSFKFHDLGEVDSAGDLNGYLKDMVGYEFNLSEAPPFEIRLIRTGTNSHVIVFMMHHIIADGWALQVIFAELIGFYKSIMANAHASPVDTLRLQNKDINSWQHKRSRAGLEKLRQYWITTLRGAQHRINLPTDHPSPAVKSFRGNQIQKWLSDGLSKRIGELSKTHNVSQFSFLLAVVKVFLYRYSNQGDLTLGSTALGRNHEALRNQIGFYLDTIVLRTFVRPEETFADFLKQVNASLSAAMEHQEYPLEAILSDLKIPRSGSYSPLFNVLVESVELNADRETTVDPDNLNIESVAIEFPYSKYDLTFKCYHEGQIGIGLEFDTDLFESSTIMDWLDNLETLLESVSYNPDEKISRLSILNAENTRKVLTATAGGEQIDISENVIAAFDRATERRPNLPAIKFADRLVTFFELQAESLKVADFIVNTMKLHKGSPVAISLKNSPQSIMAIVGVLRAGMMFVLIDPDMPPARKQTILTDSDTPLLITESEYMFEFPDFKGTLFAIDVQIQNVAAKSMHEFPAVAMDDHAYVCYTSGTTGTPKGVVVSHANLANYVAWANRYYFNDSSGFSFAFFTSISFDLTLTSIFTTLVRGDMIYIPQSRQVDQMLVEVLDPQSKVDAIKVTPSHINIIKSIAGKSAVKKVIVGGETLTSNQAAVLLQLNDHVTVYNEYGPTEATIGCTVSQVTGKESITIGTPIAHCGIRLLDSELNVQPFGVTGELYIEGACVAQGYLNQPELTAGKFRSDIAGDGKVRYKTGDLVKMLPGGELMFLGRKDNQIKINGYRVELEEIDGVLESHPGVDRAVAVYHVFAKKPVLSAFYTAETTIPREALQAFLAEVLPPYMIPQKFFRVDEIPQTLHYKVDREALLLTLNDEPPREKVKPRSDAERALALIWESLLDSKDFCVTDNFFDLGGNSLLAIQCYLRINETFSEKINIAQVYSYPTIEKLSMILERQPEVPVEKKIILVDL